MSEEANGLDLRL